MDRRNFIALGTGSALIVSGNACAPAIKLAAPGQGKLPDMREYLARIDAGMERIGKWSPSNDFPGYSGDRLAADALARKSLQTLYLTGMFSDLPLEGQLHPKMQETMWNGMPTMDAATDEITQFIDSSTDNDLENVRAALRDYDAGRMVIPLMDREAHLAGVSPAHAAQMNSMLTHVEWRLRNQPPALMVAEYRAKIERVSAEDLAVDARQRLLAARLDEKMLRQAVGTSLRDKRIGRGAKHMGIGLLIFGLSGLVVAAGGFPAVFGMTVGVIWFIVGFFMLLVGLGTSSKAVTTP